MANRTTMNISLTPELEQFVQARIACGRYQTASEVMREGLRLLEDQERKRDAVFAALKSRLEKAAIQAERGELIDGETAINNLRNKNKIPK